MMKTPFEIINNKQKKQLEYTEQGEIARLEYRFYKQSIALMHTVVPKQLEGKGIASALAETAFAYAKVLDKKVMVYCPFVAAYVKRHPEVKDQVDKDFHQY